MNKISDPPDLTLAEAKEQLKLLEAEDHRKHMCDNMYYSSGRKREMDAKIANMRSIVKGKSRRANT